MLGQRTVDAAEVIEESDRARIQARGEGSQDVQEVAQGVGLGHGGEESAGEQARLQRVREKT
ncbi:hypothetical protein RB200_23515 [Streptomyces sp. PmtG]